MRQTVSGTLATANGVTRASTPDVAGTHRTIASVRSRTAVEVANLKEATEVIVMHHYLHRGRTMAQVAYWILLDDRRVGVILFAYPRISVSFHGYHPMELLELARLWVEPRAQSALITDRRGRLHAASVATCTIGKALRRLRADWRRKYPHLPQPLAVVSWADLECHSGTYL